MMLENARVLVTGGSGFVGTNMALRLVEEGCQVRVTVHDSPLQIQDLTNIESVTADLRSAEDCARAVEGMDYVFMCAAATSGAAVMRQTPLAHVTPNVVMNAQIMEASYRAGVKRFLFVSSSAAYPDVGERPLVEDDMHTGEPSEVYYSVGWMKRYAEILCKTYASKLDPHMSTVIVRPSNIFGPYDDFEFGTSHMFAALLRRVIERHNPLEVWGTGDDERDLIFIDDFVNGALAAFRHPDQFFVANIASGQNYSVRHVLETILKADSYTDARVVFDPSKPTTIRRRSISTSLAAEGLGFRAAHSFEDGVKKTVEWYRRERAGSSFSS
jgi:GDP-L-fucose synthase